MVKYDQDYQTKDLFGKSYKGLIEFFKNYPERGTILDLGCGQGRDAIPLAELGYSVVGIDISEVGVKQMLKKAEKKGLSIRGDVHDIYEFEIDRRYDMVLLDSMLHFETRDLEKETKFLKRIMKDLKLQGVLCIFVWKMERIEDALRNIFATSKQKWEVLEDKYVEYPEHNMQYRMYIAKKIA